MGEAAFAWSPIPEGVDREYLREMAHKELDKWLDGLDPLLTKGTKESVTLLELSGHFQRTRTQLTGGLLQAAIERLYAEELERTHAPCPRCGKLRQRKRFDRKELSTLQGRVVLHRPYFYCSPCARGFHPLDEKLGICREEHQWDVQKETTRVSADFPYRPAAEHFERLTTIAAGEHFQRETLNAVGDCATLDVVIPTAEEIERRIQEATESGRWQRWRPVLVVSADGAHAPIRVAKELLEEDEHGEGEEANQWKEVKGVRMYLLAGGDRLVQLASWHRVGRRKDLERDLQEIAARIPHDMVRIALIGDGSGWVWNLLASVFPKARQILDRYHCSEYLHKVARLQFGMTLKGWEWAEVQLVRLHQDEVQEVIEALSLLRPRDAEVKKAIGNAIEYVTEHAKRMNHQGAKRVGMPAGSGAMESANKLIAHARLKRPGAWWLVESCNRILRIRCAIYNGTYDRVFSSYIDQQKTPTHRRPEGPDRA